MFNDIKKGDNGFRKDNERILPLGRLGIGGF